MTAPAAAVPGGTRPRKEDQNLFSAGPFRHHHSSIRPTVVMFRSSKDSKRLPKDCGPTPQEIAALHASKSSAVERRCYSMWMPSSASDEGKGMDSAIRWHFPGTRCTRTAIFRGVVCTCWKIYRAALFMLRYAAVAPNAAKKVVSTACLERCYEKIGRLNSKFPEARHLIVQAEDRCRASRVGSSLCCKEEKRKGEDQHLCATINHSESLP